MSGEGTGARAAAPTTSRLVTLAEAREYMSLASGVADTLIQTLIDDVSSRVNNFCYGSGGGFVAWSYYDEVDVEGPSEQSIKLSHVPIISVAAVTDNGALIASDDYHVYDYGSISLENAYFTEGFKKVCVSYVAGHSPVPGDIKEAVKKLIAGNYKSRKLRGFAMEKIGDYSYRVPDLSKGQGFPPDILQTLMQYKIITGA